MNNGIDSTKSSETPEPIKRTIAKNQHPDHVKISAEALTRLNDLGSHVSERLRGVKLTRSDLVSFLILSHSESFSASEMKDLESKYFDEVKFAQWALEELKAAKARGEERTFASILSGNPKIQPRTKKEPKHKKEKGIELSQANVSTE